MWTIPKPDAGADCVDFGDHTAWVSVRVVYAGGVPDGGVVVG